MEQRISFVTLAVSDVARSRAFYVDGLRWAPEVDVPGSVLMLMAGDHLVLSLWDRGEFEAEVGALGEAGAIPPVTLAHNVRERREVDRVLSEVARLGAPVTGPAEREWGGYTGYFADPDGFRWEVAWNPGPIGRAVLP